MNQKGLTAGIVLLVALLSLGDIINNYLEASYPR